MCLFHEWELLGIYVEPFSPLASNSNYGIKVYYGYMCKKCNKHKLTLQKTHRFTYYTELEQMVDGLAQAKAKNYHCFIQDVLSNNRK